MTEQWGADHWAGNRRLSKNLIDCHETKLLAECRLMPGQEGFWVSALASQLECAEVRPPWTLGHFRISADPETQGLQVVLSDRALMQPLHQMLVQTKGKRLPTDLRHYSPKTSWT